MSRDKVSLFSTAECNALYQAILDCADDACRGQVFDRDNHHIYQYLEQTPRTSLVAQIVDKLRKNGFEIKEAKP